MLKRPLVFVIISFILGIIFMNIKRTIVYMALLFLLFFIAINLKCLKKYNANYLISKRELKKHKIVKIILIMLIAMVIGGLYGNIDYINKIEYVKDIEGKEVNLSGVIILREDNQYLLKSVYIDGNKIRGNVKIKSNNKHEVLEELSAKVVLSLPEESMNFGGFNYRNYLYSKNIIAIGEYLYGQAKINNKLNFIESSSIRIREYISSSIDSSYPAEEAQILKAILIGESSTLEDSIREVYQNAGIIHILVVSGAHIALIIVSLKALLDKLKVSKQLYSYILILLIIIYIYITGAGESVLRAGVVSIIALVANILGRENDNITTIFLSAFILSLFNPMIIYSVGFQLSFSGALGIILLNNKIKRYLSFFPEIISDAVSVTFAAQLFVIPITAYHFNSINLIGMVSSLVVMPIINLIMPLGFLGILPLINKIITNANYFLLTLLFNDAKLFSYLNIFEMMVVTPKISCIVVYYLFLLVFFFLKIRKRIVTSWFIVLLIICTAFSNLESQNLEINYLYVGHGDSIFIVTPERKTILIDTGDNYTYKNNNYNMAEKTVIPFILDKGYKKIDLMILSHLDSDHAGGTETMIKNLRVKQVMIGENSTGSNRFLEIKNICEENNVPITLVNEGYKFNVNDVEFDILAPFTELNESENNNSIVLMMQYKGKKALFMGDMESEGEEILTKKYNLDADILKVGHHGSITSTTEKLANKISPIISIISVGTRFESLPSEEVLSRLKDSDVYVTNKNGGIEVSIDKNGEIEVETAKQ